jgi:hypothetical protein
MSIGAFFDCHWVLSRSLALTLSITLAWTPFGVAWADAMQARADRLRVALVPIEEWSIRKESAFKVAQVKSCMFLNCNLSIESLLRYQIELT